MNTAVRQLEFLLNDNQQGTVLQGGVEPEIAVMKGGRCVERVALTHQELSYLEHALGDLHKVRPLVDFHLALLKGYLNSLS